MPIEPLDYPTIEPETALGRALVDFFEVLEAVYTGFNTTLGPLHEDYEDRVIRLMTSSCVPNVEVYVAGAIDVAISKLGRFGVRDQGDIQALLELPTVDVDEFERLAKEAIDDNMDRH